MRLRFSASIGNAMRKRTYLRPMLEQNFGPLRFVKGRFETSTSHGGGTYLDGWRLSLRRRLRRALDPSLASASFFSSPSKSSSSSPSSRPIAIFFLMLSTFPSNSVDSK